MYTNKDDLYYSSSISSYMFVHFSSTFNNTYNCWCLSWCYFCEDFRIIYVRYSIEKFFFRDFVQKDYLFLQSVKLHSTQKIPRTCSLKNIQINKNIPTLNIGNINCNLLKNLFTFLSVNVRQRLYFEKEYKFQTTNNIFF